MGFARARNPGFNLRHRSVLADNNGLCHPSVAESALHDADEAFFRDK